MGLLLMLADFVSLNMDLFSDSNEDGSLPNIDFMKFVSWKRFY